MNGKIKEDLIDMEKKLSLYMEKGRVAGSAEIREEPMMAVKPEPERIKPLRKASSFEGQFLAVDCSTRTLKRANNWGIYLLRVSNAILKGRDVDWGYEERICTVVGDASIRYRFLGDVRVELESQMALDIVRRRKICEGDFLLLDGPSYFGGTRKFRISLYEECNASKIIFIIVLDEIDALIKARGDDLLYELTRINETLGKSKVTLIGISNDLRLKEFLDSRVLSSLSEEEIVFRPYDAGELRNILLFLEKRVDKVRSPTFNPNYRDKVYTASEEDCSVLKLSGELEIGRLRSGEQLLGPVGINSEAIPLMMGMFGMTGSGKTNTELVLNAQIIDNSPKIVALIFDFAGQLLEGKGIKPQKGLKDHPLFHSKVQYYSARNGKMAVGLYTITPDRLITLFPDIGLPQFRLARKLYKKLGKVWIRETREVYGAEGYAGVGRLADYKMKHVIEALMLKLSSLSHDLFPASDYSFVDRVTQNICKGITCLVDISGISSEEQNKITCLTASAVAQHYRRMWEENYEEWWKLPTLLITLEEAHEFLDPNKPRTIFSDIALTYRKYRVGLNAVTPRPSRINFDVFAELWTKIVMKTELRKDRAYLTENTPYLEYSDTEIKMLDVGEALLISEPKIRFAVPIKVTHYPEYLDERELEDYGLPESQKLSDMDKRLKKLSEQESLFLQ